MGYIVYLEAMSTWCHTGDGDESDVCEGDVALPRTGSDEPVDMLEHSAVSTIGPGGSCDDTGSVADAPGDVIVVSSECRDIDRGTLDSIRICRADPQSQSTVCCGPFCSIIFDEGRRLFPAGICTGYVSVLRTEIYSGIDLWPVRSCDPILGFVCI